VPGSDQEPGLAWGVEPLCEVLSQAGVAISPSTYYEWVARTGPSAVEVRHDLVADLIRAEREHPKTGRFASGLGARKMWLRLRAKGHDVARCVVEKVMADNGWEGARYGSKHRTTIADESHDRHPDMVERNFAPARPNRLWVADFTYVPTWTGMVYVAFVIDAYARRIIGWRAATSMTTPLVLDALEHALFTRTQEGVDTLAGLVSHSDAGSQYTSIAFTSRLIEEGIDPSVGSVGDAYDNALAEATIGTYKTEFIRRLGPWRNVDHVETETMFWVDWYNTERSHDYLDDLTPAHAEELHYAFLDTLQKAG
jgi:putative transposase